MKRFRTPLRTYPAKVIKISQTIEWIASHVREYEIGEFVYIMRMKLKEDAKNGFDMFDISYRCYSWWVATGSTFEIFAKLIKELQFATVEYNPKGEYIPLLALIKFVEDADEDVRRKFQTKEDEDLSEHEKLINKIFIVNLHGENKIGRFMNAVAESGRLEGLLSFCPGIFFDIIEQEDQIVYFSRETRNIIYEYLKTDRAHELWSFCTGMSTDDSDDLIDYNNIIKLYGPSRKYVAAYNDVDIFFGGKYISSLFGHFDK